MLRAAHAYARLVAIAPDAGAHVLAQELLADALSYEGERFQQNVHYLVEIAGPADFERLRDVFRPARGAEADRLIGHLALSAEIYAPYRSGLTPPADAFYESGRARETNMKRLFTERYRSATAGGARLPKVLVKSGHLHLYRGLSARSELYTLGNFLSELAIFNGLESLHIYAIVDRPHVRDGWLAPFAQAAHPGEATVFDLRPLAAWARRERTLDPSLRRLLLGYDVLVFLRDGATGSVEGLRTPRFRWYPEPD